MFLTIWMIGRAHMCAVFFQLNFFCCDETTKEIVDVMYFLCFLKRKKLET